MPKIFLLEDFLYYSSFKMNQCRQQQNLHLMKLQRFCWLSHVAPKDEFAISISVF